MMPCTTMSMMLLSLCFAIALIAPPTPCSADVSAIVTDSIFDHFLPDRHWTQEDCGSGATCPRCSPNFYTRQAFVAAAKVFPAFGSTGTPETQRREMAAFFAHVAHETGRGCHARQVTRTPGDNYYGRGPLQLTGLANYQDAGTYLHFDGVHNPDIVATDSTISFKTAIWFWMQRPGPNSPTCHNTVVNHQGFGPTTRTINGGYECAGGSAQNEQQDRINLYLSYCNSLGISCNNNLHC